MKDLIQRTVTGGIFIILVYGSLFAGKLFFLFFYLSLLIAAILEFSTLMQNEGHRIQKIAALVLSVIMFLLLFGYSSGILPGKWLCLFALYPLFIMIYELYRKAERSYKNVFATFYGIIYITLPISLLSLIVFPGDPGAATYYPGIAAGVFMLVMINDTAAYLVGVPFGKNRLFESVSPKKTWEGSIGGGASVILASVFMNHLFHMPGQIHWIVIGILVFVFGVYGDLAESLLKRQIGIKDSGKLLPGHGGILDRIDSWFFVIPVVWVYLEFII